jgi:hypothetical protein
MLDGKYALKFRDKYKHVLCRKTKNPAFPPELRPLKKERGLVGLEMVLKNIKIFLYCLLFF